ncbi:Wzz/FepE/Etk N-terminal domain-containing protein [Dyella subtropica]|uniref:Wzz/FepE/Etk N-terminal domain-containing protein n=1 Tax=Dyella subtropica TaxID=2992127 RepID=UPI00224CACD6|nr:Wzz/FepE/Etk N-terminal domain-containing protein [Dyella subtropica]
MEQDEVYLVDLWRIFSREWRWVAAALVVALACTYAFTHRLKNQWEATAWIQIGQVGQVGPLPQGQDPKIEPLQRVLERLQMAPFQNGVMSNLGFSPDSPEAQLYRKSIKLDPLPYAGPLVRMSLRAYSPQQARQFAEATVKQLQAIHQQLEATPLTLAHARLDEIQTALRDALAERDRLQQAITPGNRDDAGGKSIQNPLLASVLLSSKNTEIRGLQSARSDLADRLSSTYTYETSLLGAIYVPDRRASPNLVLIWGVGIFLGASLGALIAMARNALRRRGHTPPAFNQSGPYRHSRSGSEEIA